MCLSLKSPQLSEYSICEKLYMFTKRKLKKHRTLSNLFCWKLRLCFWHCLKAANDYAKWSKIARKDNGYAVNSRHVAKEVADARDLKDNLIQLAASRNMTYFIPEVLETGEVALQEIVYICRLLNVCIRVTVEDKATKIYIYI